MKKLLLLLLLLSTPAFADSTDKSAEYVLNRVFDSATNALKTSGSVAGSSAGSVTNLSCSDNIQTKITAATAGDTLLLGSCNYNISTGLTIDKALTLKGQGKAVTTITATAAIAVITATADNVNIVGLSVNCTIAGSACSGIKFDSTGGTTSLNENLRDLNVTVSKTSGSPTAILYDDAGGTIDNVVCTVTGTGMTGTDQTKCIFKRMFTSSDADTSLDINNVYVNSTGGGNSTNTLLRGVMNYIQGGSFNSTTTMRNSVIIITPLDAITPTNGYESEKVGSATNTNIIYDSYIDGGLTGTGVINIDVRYENVNMTLHNTVLKNNRLSNTGAGADAVIDGTMQASGMYGTAMPERPINGLSSGQGAYKVFSLTGQKGGDTSIATTGTGGSGGALDITLGAGGVADSANTASTGGAGGGMTWTMGNGASAIVGTGTNTGGAGGSVLGTGGTGGAAQSGTTNTGGAGGARTLTGGTGGTATGGTTATGGRGGHINITAGSGASATGATTNNGGNGGIIYLLGGAKGTGSTANGTDGDILMLADSSFTNRGVVLINPTVDSPMDSANMKLEVLVGEGIDRFSSTAGNGAQLFFNRAHGTQTTPTAVVSGDTLGFIDFQGYDGNSWESTARIRGKVDSTVSDGAMPTALEFYTGTAITQSQKAVITSAGDVGIGSTVPLSILDVRHATAPVETLERNDATVTSGEVIGEIDYSNNDSTLTTQNLYGKIVVSAAQTISTDAASANMDFYTTSPSVAGVPILAMTLTPSQDVAITQRLTSSRTTDFGWTVKAGANTACNTTCTSACVFGEDTSVVGTIVACTDGTADVCLCAGSS